MRYDFNISRILNSVRELFANNHGIKLKTSSKRIMKDLMFNRVSKFRI